MSGREILGCLVYVLGFIFLVGFFLYEVNKGDEREKADRAIVKEMAGLVESCRGMGGNIKILGKVLVWDMKNNKHFGVYFYLPDELISDPSDNPITVFMILGLREESVGTYSISHQTAYRQYVDIAVAYWPEKKPVGFFSVLSQEPPSSRQVQQRPEYGDPTQPVAKWIKSLERINR